MSRTEQLHNILRAPITKAHLPMVCVSENRVLPKKGDSPFLKLREYVLNPGKGEPLQEIISSLGLTFTQVARGHVLTDTL